MSKLWKQEWKYHIIFNVITTVVLFLAYHSDLVGGCYDLFNSSNNETMTPWMLLDYSNWIMATLDYQFLEGVRMVVFVCLLVKKSFIYWIEQNGSGREFIQSLPVTKMNRAWFHLLMDLMQIVLPVFVYGLYEYVQLNTILANVAKIHIPWLLESMLGMMLTTICYAVMMLGVLYLMEVIFVSGSMKLIGFVGMFFMTGSIFYCLFEQFYTNPLVQNVIGFFTMEAAGGAQYDLLLGTDIIFNDVWSMEYDSHYAWFYEHMDPPFRYMGEWFDYSSLNASAHDFKVWLDQLNGVYAFSEVSNYIFYALGYLAIGFIIIGLVMVLTDKKELSKEGFYFDFGRYLTSAMIALTVFCMITDWQGKLWLIVLDVVASVVIFFLMQYLLDSNRRKFFSKKKLVDKNESITA